MFILVSFLVQAGCTDSDGPGDSPPPPENCSITITAPAAGASYQVGDPVIIRWTETGTAAQVRIDLLKGGSLVNSIGIFGNDGHRIWDTSNLGVSSGSDFSIRVTAVGEVGCSATSREFTIINTAGCNFNFTNDFDPDHDPDTPLQLIAPQEFEITWESTNTAGLVDIELLRMDLGPEAPVAYIVSGTPDDGSYLWPVDSFHRGTYEYYRFRISDAQVSGCSALSDRFGIIDDDICVISVTNPESSVVWTAGQTRTITFTAQDSGTTHVNIRLYLGAVFVNDIAVQLAVPAPGQEQDVSWLVDTTGSQVPNSSSYKIRVLDAYDEFCSGWSSDFTINGN